MCRVISDMWPYFGCWAQLQSFCGHFGISSLPATFKSKLNILPLQCQSFMLFPLGMLKLGQKNNDVVYVGYVPRVSSQVFTSHRVTFQTKNSSPLVRVRNRKLARNLKLASQKSTDVLDWSILNLLFYKWVVKNPKWSKVCQSLTLSEY